MMSVSSTKTTDIITEQPDVVPLMSIDDTVKCSSTLTVFDQLGFCVFSGAGHFFNRNSMSPHSVVCEMELPDIQASLDLYDDKS